MIAAAVFFKFFKGDLGNVFKRIFFKDKTFFCICLTICFLID